MLIILLDTLSVGTIKTVQDGQSDSFLYLKKIILLKIDILYCPVLLYSVLF